MSSEAMKWARRQMFRDGVLSNVVGQLALLADKNGTSNKSQPYLAAACGISDRSVRTALAMLDALGVITRTVRSRGRQGRITDLVTLALHKSFDLSREDIQRVRPPRRREFQPEAGSGSNRKHVPGYITSGQQTLQQEEGISNVEGSSTDVGQVVVQFPMRRAG